jgi:hypothetical protein
MVAFIYRPLLAGEWVSCVNSAPALRLPGGARSERNRDDLAALAGDDEGPVPEFHTRVLDALDGDKGS